jgi:7-cyano-7-deazaguanine synthase
MPKNAIVLLSGGLDSATTLALAKHDGFDPHALTFRYGQRHALELKAARRVAAHQGVAGHLEVEIDLRMIGGSALTADVDVPEGRSLEEMESGIPVTYVPARNTIFLSFALAWAEVLRVFDIFIGVNAVDYSGYPDCREEYVLAYERMANLATKAAVESGRSLRIHTPLIELSKAEIVKRGVELGVDFAMTSSCYSPSPSGEACGRCDSCRIRLRGFADAGVTDPIRYRPGVGVAM